VCNCESANDDVYLFSGLKYIFLVGGFAESSMLQLEVRNALSDVAKILVPSEAGLTILKGEHRRTVSLD